MHWVYYFGRVLIYILLAPFGWIRVVGKENVPDKGPVLIVSNHLSLGDPPLIAASIKLKAVIMAKEELFQHPWSRFWVKNFGAFPVRRDGVDRQALKDAESWLNKGISLIIFPEGRRSLNAAMEPALPGAALLAARLGVPILPVGITGTEKLNHLKHCFFHRTKVVITIGKPFKPPAIHGRITREHRNALIHDMMKEIAALLPPEYRGVYAGENDAES
ncbi:MAG: 1-acyl-sn-glycerol-3-phosphate acyltransferase [Dehalococcoidales bacterium]|nr:1-acyl-sn-glycerol-3-phosphate acyltransferase [Dehalococcoidales bacterium]